ncbi:MAG TPA: ABC transporter permease, partial [Rhodothermales bacterium]|nr:ABC transporter permease [Rhodothermales bacterium]
MLKNYLLVALRTTRRQRGYAAINVFGLALGLACAFLITLYVRHELSYDRQSANADRVYRLTSEVFISGEHTHYARTASGVGGALQAADPTVEATARLWHADPVVEADEEKFYGERFYYADPLFFHVFATPFLAGSPTRALTAPWQVVLTETTARRYFGEADPMGRAVRIGAYETPFQVVGVIADVPEAAHVHYDVLASMANWLPEESPGPDAWVSNMDYLAYVLLRPGARPEGPEATAAGLVEENVGGLLTQLGATYQLHLQPLASIHLHSALSSEAEPTGDVLYVWVFASVALIVLLIACINFTNLATARAMDRAKEVGMRKALGAGRVQLVRQFLAESVVLTLFALVLAVALVALLLPVFNDLTGRHLTLDGTLGAFALMALLAPAVGLLAGAYPAFVLSGYRPAETLRGRFRSGRSGLVLRRALVVTQFALSVILVTGAFVVQDQLAYARTQRLGFDREQVVVLPLRPDEGIRQQEAAFKAAVLGSSHVVSATLTDNYPSGVSEPNQ